MHRIESFVVIILSILTGVRSTPLDDYVNAPDPTFSWKLIQTYPSTDYTVYILNMTSQTWKDSSFSSQPVWWHYMVVTVPKVLRRGNRAFMLIGGGDNTDNVPTQSWTSGVASAAGSVAVELKQIPNQPIVFKADPSQQSREEDAIIAWTWKTFIENNASDPYILLRMPMTKAAVRGMDATQEFLKQLGVQVPEKFVIGGLSKRGWTTWTTAAVDNKRVIGAFPIVMDMVNLHKNMMNHYQSLAGWTFAFQNYYVENTTLFLDNPNFQKMADIIDPYVYFARYQNTKILQFQAADDQFFLPDSEEFFWDDLQKATGGSHLRRIPNVGHNIQGYQDSLASFYMTICDNAIRPLWTWTRTANETHGQIVATVSIIDGHPKPTAVTVYQARTVPGTKRDFRLNILDPTTHKIINNPIKWIEQTNIQTETTSQSIIYSYTTAMPPQNFWDAAFIQVTFPGPDNSSVILTTETLIIPNTHPIGPCQGVACYGTLV